MNGKDLIEKLIKEIDDSVSLDAISGGTANRLKHIVYQLDELVNPVEAIVRQGVPQPVQNAGSKHKKYIIFGFDTYYPSGGMDDLLEESCDTIDEARKACSRLYMDNFQIVDRDTLEIIKEL